MRSRPARSRGLLVGLTAASVGLVYGYDLSIIAGAQLYVTEDFGLSTRQQELLTTMAVIGQIAGALGAGMLANAIGRKKSVVLLLVAYAAFALLGALSASLPMLLAARLLLGLTIGVAVVVVPVYIAESAPTAVRGSLLTAYQLAIVSGLIAGYLTGYLLAGIHGWRWMLGLAAVPAMLLLPLLIRAPTRRGGMCSRAGSTTPARRCCAWSPAPGWTRSSPRSAARWARGAAAGRRCCDARIRGPPPS